MIETSVENVAIQSFIKRHVHFFNLVAFSDQ